jgi:hypothetical protein
LPDAKETTAANAAPEKESRWTLKRVVILATAGFIALIAAPFVIGLLIAAVTDVGGFGDVVRVLRDIAIIILALVSSVIAIAIAVLILQVAQLIGIVQTDIKPLLEELRATATATRGTVKFVGDTVSTPLAKAGGFFAGLWVFLREFGGIRRAIRHREPKTPTVIEEKEAS